MIISFGTISTRMLQAFSSFWLMLLAFIGSVVQVLLHSEVTKCMGCYYIHLLVAFLLCCEIWWHDDIRRENDYDSRRVYTIEEIDWQAIGHLARGCKS